MVDVSQSDASKRPFFVWLSFLTSVVGGVVGFVAAQFIAFGELRTKQDDVADKIHATKLKVVEHVANAEFAYADAVLLYLLEPIEKDKNAFKHFRDQVREQKAEKAPTKNASATTPPPQNFSSSIAFPYTSAQIRSRFNTAERLDVSNELVNLYKSHPAATVEALIATLIQEQSTDLSRYRVNLYVVFTLARIPGGWMGSPQQLAMLTHLRKSAEHADPTFASRLAEAVSNYRKP
jgi:hypothetical protein